MYISPEPKVDLNDLVLTAAEERILKSFAEFKNIPCSSLRHCDITRLEKYSLISRNGVLDEKGNDKTDNDGNCIAGDSYRITELGTNFYLKLSDKKRSHIFNLIGKIIEKIIP